MAKMPKEMMDLLKDPQASKVLATADSGGKLNVVPKGSLSAIDEETVAYAFISEGKTEANLKATSKVAAAVFKLGMPPTGYQVKGTFEGFQASGPLFDRFAKMLKGMKIEAKAVGTIKVEEVYSVSLAERGRKVA